MIGKGRTDGAIRIILRQAENKGNEVCSDVWQGRQDSNLRMAESKSDVLPLHHAPTSSQPSRVRFRASAKARCARVLLLFGRDPLRWARARGIEVSQPSRVRFRTSAKARCARVLLLRWNAIQHEGRYAHGKNSGIGRLPIPLFVGWVKGLEPSTPGTTIRCSNQLSYTHHREKWYARRDSNPRPTA